MSSSFLAKGTRKMIMRDLWSDNELKVVEMEDWLSKDI
jgi:hypothetical protein